MALTLAQVNKLTTEPLEKYVIMNVLRHAKVMELLPFENVSSLTSIAVRIKTLPTVAFRRVNGQYTANEGDTEQVHESVYAFGGDIIFDRVFEKVKNLITDPIKLNVDMKTMAASFMFTDYLINGDHGVDPDGFEGLKKRISNMPTRQKVGFAGATAGALDPTSSVAAATTFFKYIDMMYHYCNGGQVNAILCNEGMAMGMGHVARYINANGGAFFSTQKDSFDREIPTYRGAPIIDVGLKSDQTTEIITDSETAGDAGTDATSIYMTSFDEQQGVRGIQLSPLEVYDPLKGGEDTTAPVKKRRLEWWVGLASFGSYGFVRGWNVEGSTNWTA